MATVNLYIRPEMKDLEGNAPIYLIYQHQGKKFKHYTGYKIDLNDWDSKYQRVKESASEGLVINENILAQKEKLNTLLKEMAEKGKEAQLLDIKQLFSNGKRPEKRNSFYTHFEQYIHNSKESKKKGTLIIYEALLKDLKSFDSLSSYKLDFKKIDTGFYEQFTAYLSEELNNGNNTISKKIKTLKSFLNYAAGRGLLPEEQFENFNTKTTSGLKVSLTEQEIARMYNLNLSLSPELAQTRDIFFFGCVTGLKYSEIMLLKPSDVVGDRLVITNQYTGKELSVPMNNYAKMIIKRYESYDRPHCFPQISNVYANRFIKEVGKIAGIDNPISVQVQRGKHVKTETRPRYELITTDTARLTYAAISLQSGMRAEFILQIMGQKNIHTLLQYCYDLKPPRDLEIIDSWNKKVF